MSDATVNPADRRSEPRLQAQGTVTIEASEPFRRSIQGELLDVSPSGFRISHHDEDLLAGQRVHFQLQRTPDACLSGIALVAWRRILGGHIECGCHIEESKP